MCYAIPGKIIQINGKVAVVDYFGEKRNVLNDSLPILIGDYVYAQGGIIVDKIEKKDAVEILNIWEKQFFELKKIDKKLAKQDKIIADSNLLEILQKVNLRKTLHKNELLQLLRLKTKQELKLLYQTANNIRQREQDNACCVHGIIEFSNCCKNNCLYCGIRKDRKIKRYRMTENEIIKIATDAVNKFAFKALVLQSGEDYWYDQAKLSKIVKEIRKLNILIFLSIGIRSKETYKKLYEMGARAVLLRFETSNETLFNKNRPQTDFKERIELIKFLKNMGYIVATGFLIGLPGETDEDIINNILLTKSLMIDMYSFGPLIPAQDTPLKNHKQVKENTVLKIIAISRFLDRQAKILVTSSLETLGENAKKKGLLAGANSLMINVTPKSYQKLYDLYPGRDNKEKELGKNIKKTVDLLYSLGRAPTDIGVK